MKIKLYTLKLSSFFIGLMITVFCFTAGVLYAQNKTVQVTQKWHVNDSSWHNYERNTTNYNNSCRANYSLRELWDTTTNQWKNDSQDSVYSNSFGSPDSIYSQLWEGNAWVNYSFIRYTYNNKGQLTSLTVMIWNGNSFENENKSTYTYDSNSYLINQLYQQWDAVANAWINDEQFLYSNNADGTPAAKYAEFWNKNSNSWILSSTITHLYYNNFGKDSVNITVDSSNVIINENKQEFFYDAKQNLINEISFYPNFDTGGWDTSSQYLYSPNAQGLDTVIIYQNITNAQWVNNQKTTITYTSCVLPVTFVNFSAQLINKSVQLNWQTGSEVNASLFHVQRSTDGKAYTNITNINAKGQSFNNYSYKDDISSIHQPVIYYRLLEQDKDGKLQMSNTVVVALNKPVSALYVISPNPASNKVYVTGGPIALVDIYDLNGRLMISQKPSADNSINVSQLSKGIYMVRIQDCSNHISSTKLIVQ